MRDLDRNQLVSQILVLENRLRKIELEVEEFKVVVEPLRKSYLELLELAMSYRERLGLDNIYFESDWMEKANLL